MKLAALQSKNKDFSAFVELVGSVVDTDLYEDLDFMIAHLGAYRAMVIDLSLDVHIVNKLLKTFTDTNPSMDIIPVDFKGRSIEMLNKTYSDNPFKLVLQGTMEKAEVKAELEQFFEDEMSQSTRSVVLRVIQDHLEGDLSEKAKLASNDLDSLFENEFSQEYELKNNSNNQEEKSLGEFQFTIDEGEDVSKSNEDDLSIELSGDDLDLDIGDDTPTEVADEAEGLDLSLDDDIGLDVESNSAASLEEDASDLVVDDFDEPTIITQTPDPSLADLEFNASEEIVDQDEPSFSIEEEILSPDEENNISNGDDSISIDEDSFSLEEDFGDLSEEIQLSEETRASQMFELGADSENVEDVSGLEGESLKLSRSEGDEISFGDDDLESTVTDMVDSENPLEELKTKILELDSILAADNEDLSSDSTTSTGLSLNDSMNIVEEEELTENYNLDQGDFDEFSEDIEENEPTNIMEPTQETQVSLKSSAPTQLDSSPSGHEFNEFKKYHEDELLRLSETIKALRADRDRLSQIVTEQEKQLQGQQDGKGYLQAEIDEKKIEIEIIKKRNLKQVEDIGIKLELAQNKNDILKEQNKVYQREIEKLQKENRLDHNHKRSRERELEEKLELLKKDSEVQIRNRDHKILDLKRQIDSLEFDVESATTRERQIQIQQQVVEDKMSKVIRTLRSVIGQVEDDNILEERKKLIKKNLDV